MNKFEIEYYTVNTNKEIIEAIHDSQAVEKFRQEHEYAGIKSVKYVYEGNEEPTEWYCMWWNGNSWNSKVVLAHNRDEILYNIKDSLDYAVYNFSCCLNNNSLINALHRDTWD